MALDKVLQMMSTLFLLFVAMTAEANSGTVCTGFVCDSGQCVSQSVFCNGMCDCGDCSDEKRQNCPSFSSPDDNGKSNSSLGNGGIIGIVVAAICLLLLLIAFLIVFLICRIRREAQKNSRNRRACIDPSLLSPGCALPADIPIEALTRQPPPQYTPRSEVSTTQFTISVLPPPYYSGAGAVSTVEMSYTYEAPPKYQSVADLSDLPTGLHHPKNKELDKKSPELRRNSVDSFVGVPSMSNILLTSSRSSVLGSESCPADDRRPGLSSSQTDSARGESIMTSKSRRSIDSAASSSRMLDVRSQSRSLSNILSDSIEIPEHGLKKYVNDPKSNRSSNPSRSVPALEGAAMTRNRKQDMTSSSPDASDVSRKPKQRRYHKHKGSQNVEAGADGKGEQNPTSGTTSHQRETGHTGRLVKSKKIMSRSLPQLATLQEEARWEEIGSCEV